MKKAANLIKPAKSRSKSALTKNIFSSLQQDSPATEAQRQNYSNYDFVGPLQFRKRLLSKYPSSKKAEEKSVNNQQALNSYNETIKSKNILNNTISKDTYLSSLNKEQQIQLTKHARNLIKFNEYKHSWQKNAQYIRRQIHKKNPTLMEDTIKKIYVHPNEDKIDIINNYIVNYWQMSLRNNNPILERHIKGNTFDKVQKEKLMQLRSGSKKIEDSIPILPINRFNNYKNREICLSGRNKIKKQAQNSHQRFNTTRYSVGSNTIRLAQQQVFKIDYQGGKKYMGSQNL